MARDLYVTNPYKGLEIWQGFINPSLYVVAAWNAAGWPEILMITEDKDKAESQAWDWEFVGSVSIKKGNTILSGPADGAASVMRVMRD